MQVFAATNYMDAMCPGVEGAAGPLPEKTEELND